MGGIREFQREDGAAVAALWLRVFRQCDRPASHQLQEYFAQVFFDHPWPDPQLPSLVYEERGRGIVGFLGVLPRRMSFRGRSVKVAVATQLMAEQGTEYAAAKLIRRFLAGTQELSFSDGANDAARALWRAAGGELALLNSMTWTRVLRPAGHALARLAGRKPTRRATAALRPLGAAVDAVFAATRWGRIWLPGTGDTVVDEAPKDDVLLWCIEHLSGERALRPEYRPEDLRWLLAQAAGKRNHGPLVKGVVRGAGGAILGWYLYYAGPGGIAEVLQFGGRPRAVGKVLLQLFHGAQRRGALAVRGALEPRFCRELAQCRCALDWAQCHVLVHSRHRELLSAIHRGDAFLTRLEGEWWARFSDPQWSVEGVAPGAPAASAAGPAESPRWLPAQ